LMYTSLFIALAPSNKINDRDI